MKKFEKKLRVIMEQLASSVIDTKKLSKDMTDNNMLRLAIQAELDAVNLYEQMAATTSDNKIKEVMLDVAREEKVHVEEFTILLQRRDKEQEQAVSTASDEVGE